jgi:hypothetical protein
MRQCTCSHSVSQPLRTCTCRNFVSRAEAKLNGSMNTPTCRNCPEKRATAGSILIASRIDSVSQLHAFALMAQQTKRTRIDPDGRTRQSGKTHDKQSCTECETDIMSQPSVSPDLAVLSAPQESCLCFQTPVHTVCPQHSQDQPRLSNQQSKRK